MISSHNYAFRRELLENHECIERVWLGSDTWKNKHDMIVKDDDTITFGHCLRTDFIVRHNLLLAEMTVFSDGYSGFSARCKLTFKITKAGSLLKSTVMDYIDDDAEAVIREKDEEILRQRLNKAKLAIIAGL
jgi:hypothetical protein